MLSTHQKTLIRFYCFRICIELELRNQLCKYFRCASHLRSISNIKFLLIEAQFLGKNHPNSPWFWNSHVERNSHDERNYFAFLYYFSLCNNFMMILSYTWIEFGVNWTSMRTQILETDFRALKLCIAAQFSVWFLGPFCHSKFGILYSTWKIKLKKKWTWSIFSLLQQLLFWKLVHFTYSEKAPNILKKIYHFSLTFFRQPVPPLGMDSTKASTGCRTSWKMLKTNK